MRVVLVRLSAMGDIVHTWPLAEALRAAQPDIHLTWIVEESFEPLVNGHPAVDDVITVATKRWRWRMASARTRAEIADLRRRLHEIRPELAIDPQGVVKSAVIVRSTEAPARIGLARPWRRERLAGLAYTSTLPGSTSHRHVVATNLELVRAVGGVPPREVPHPDGRWLLDLTRSRLPSLVSDPRYAVLLPGAGWASKTLPPETLSKVADGIASLSAVVILAWGPGERDTAAAVVALAGPQVQLAPPTDLEQLVVLLGGASLVVGGDTGPVHLAASLGVPTVAVFTATDWQRNGPLGARVDVVSGVRTAPPGPISSAHAAPVRTITADEVVARAAGLLAGGSP